MAIKKEKKDRFLNLGWGYSVPSSLMNLQLALGLLMAELLLGTLGYMILENYSAEEAIYMTIITISTVGFTEVQPLDIAGRIFTTILILANIGIFAYLLAVFSYFIIQGEIFKKMHLNLINNRIAKLEDHIILCGYGKYGREAAAHFDDHKLSYIVIDKDPELIENIQKSEDPILYIEGDATTDETLEKAGIDRAAAIISALPDDSENVFIVLTARQINPEIKIISRARDPRTNKKLLKAGANHVVMPDQIGGFYMATLVSKPSAVEFFSFLTNDFHSDIGFEEISFDKLSPEYQHKTIRELGVRHATGANIIGYKQPNGKYIVNPPPDTAFLPNSSFIILGNSEQLRAVRDFFSH
ncbi:potassium channel family protein [Flavilitoribacter nigricans]|uniref:Potassium channel protein n=1 Tax=Flavilitoribacter nigricans (strain ATCC 23147 / DSM 23189 / NBRC 102662 / NCIMB 1420 / SS-2) TaxID=1122177 RepID=A0A2D0NFU1_FLAN2|nr:potassium channel protein [Flavilitoribacter nigricans]PHN07372.1 potassium channel protein [Flavilitoribacter nigricans DSM 23189 = NBRC 102662]